MNKNDFEKYFLPIGADGNHDSGFEKFLCREDYKDFASQYKENKITEISSTLKEKYRNVKLSETEKEQTGYTTNEYLEFSKILFSHDRQTAYIEVNYYAGIYGDGTGYILRKNNGVWKIVQRINKWIT
ncbi:nuclear transport factor 2 family protein [Chryseobacterium indologenes]|uniref:nuclear transport factor 2 family protein n=1 Tax=Chryseobacterium indologenes TaxID=253 RepID=UPI0011AB85C5|nr:nuclear transport factor 2 family protein [Chryseobacterium indologenes]